MKILLDTSVLVAAIVEAHPAHKLTLPWLQRVKTKEDIGVVAAHSIAELYAILTTLPIQPRISPKVAKQLIQQDVLSVCEIVALSDEDYRTVITIHKKTRKKNYFHFFRVFRVFRGLSSYDPMRSAFYATFPHPVPLLIPECQAGWLSPLSAVCRL